MPSTSKILYGREADLGWLDACWQTGVRVASIVAFGGVGKSALVNGWLAQMDAAGWRGVKRVYAWSFYSQGTDRLSSSDEFIARALQDFGDPDPVRGSPWDKGERLAKLVSAEKSILVLDGVEPLQWGPGVQEGKLKDPALEALLKGLASHDGGLCLVTTRIALTDFGRGHKVESKSLDKLSPEAGAALLRAKGIEGDEEELKRASDEYKGHGLGLTLLASYLEDVAEKDIRRRHEIGPLMGDERQGGHAKRVMIAYEKWLGDAEVAILRMMGLFDRPADEGEIGALRAKPMIPGFTDAVVGIGGREWNKAIAKLRRAGLLLIEHDKRLDAHPLVREHFGEQLRIGQPEAWREGHRRLYEYLKKIARPLPGTIEEMAPLYAAVVHGCLAGKNQEAFEDIFVARINRGTDSYHWSKLGAFGSEAAILSAFFDPPWERLAPGLSDAAVVKVWNAASRALAALGRLSEALELKRLVVTWYVDREDWKNAAKGAARRSGLLQLSGDLSHAEAEARHGVHWADKSNHGFQRLSCRATLAAARHALGRAPDGDGCFEDADRMQGERLQGRPPSEHPLLYSYTGFLLNDILFDWGRETEVPPRAELTLRLAEKQGYLPNLALDHLSLGRAHLLGAQRGTGGDIARATFHLNQAVDGFRHAGDQSYFPLGLLARAALHIHNRDFADARHDLEEALSLATRCEFRLHEADAHLGYARLALAEKDHTAAQEHLAKAKAIIEKTGYHRRDGEAEELSVAVARAFQRKDAKTQ